MMTVSAVPLSTSATASWRLHPLEEGDAHAVRLGGDEEEPDVALPDVLEGRRDVRGRLAGPPRLRSEVPATMTGREARPKEPAMVSAKTWMELVERAHVGGAARDRGVRDREAEAVLSRRARRGSCAPLSRRCSPGRGWRRRGAPSCPGPPRAPPGRPNSGMSRVCSGDSSGRLRTVWRSESSRSGAVFATSSPSTRTTSALSTSARERRGPAPLRRMSAALHETVVAPAPTSRRRSWPSRPGCEARSSTRARRGAIRSR